MGGGGKTGHSDFLGVIDFKGKSLGEKKRKEGLVLTKHLNESLGEMGRDLHQRPPWWASFIYMGMFQNRGGGMGGDGGGWGRMGGDGGKNLGVTKIGIYIYICKEHGYPVKKIHAST